jgi:hypothetical protein
MVSRTEEFLLCAAKYASTRPAVTPPFQSPKLDPFSAAAHAIVRASAPQKSLEGRHTMLQRYCVDMLALQAAGIRRMQYASQSIPITGMTSIEHETSHEQVSRILLYYAVWYLFRTRAWLKSFGMQVVTVFIAKCAKQLDNLEKRVSGELSLVGRCWISIRGRGFTLVL